MLRIECYAVLDGLAVTVLAVPLHKSPDVVGGPGARVHRTVPVETLEQLGMEEALRDCLVDIMQLYPGLLKHALD